jgi:hypothetical protein
MLASAFAARAYARRGISVQGTAPDIAIASLDTSATAPGQVGSIIFTPNPLEKHRAFHSLLPPYFLLKSAYMKAFFTTILEDHPNLSTNVIQLRYFYQSMS